MQTKNCLVSHITFSEIHPKMHRKVHNHDPKIENYIRYYVNSKKKLKRKTDTKEPFFNQPLEAETDSDYQRIKMFSSPCITGENSPEN